MEESSPLPTTTRATKRSPEISVTSRIGKVCLSVAASLQEGFGYFKAFLIGQAKKMRARSEKEASEADLQTAKMEVEAADAAEDTKKRLDKTY